MNMATRTNSLTAASCTYRRMLNDVRESYGTNPKRGFDLHDGNIFIIRLIRPLSIFVTPLFIMMGFSANAATWTGFGFGILGAALIAIGAPGAVQTGAWLYLICFIFDHVDGNIARFHGKTNHYGKFIDGTAGLIVHVAMFLALGIGAYRFSVSTFLPPRYIPFNPAYLLLLGGLAASASVTMSYISTRYSMALAEAFSETSPTTADTRGKSGARLFGIDLRLIKRNVTRTQNLVAAVEIPLLFVAAYMDLLPVYIVLFAAYTVAMCAITYLKVLHNGRNSLDVFRAY